MCWLLNCRQNTSCSISPWGKWMRHKNRGIVVRCVECWTVDKMQPQNPLLSLHVGNCIYTRWDSLDIWFSTTHESHIRASTGGTGTSELSCWQLNCKPNKAGDTQIALIRNILYQKIYITHEVYWMSSKSNERNWFESSATNFFHLLKNHLWQVAMDIFSHALR